MINELIFDSLTINDSHIYGGVKYSQVTNSETDLQVGTTACAEVSFTTDALQTDSVNSAFEYKVTQNGDTESRTVGKFNIKEVTKNTNGKYEVKAYDNVILFDKIVDSWIDSLTYPITLGNMFSSLCTYCGCTAGSTTFTNSTMSVNNNFTGMNITGRTILGYLAQAGGGFAKAGSDGKIYIKTYTTNSTSLDNSKYKTFWYTDYSAPIIDKVWVGQEDGDIGVMSGTGEIVLNIESNPLFFTDSISAIQGNVNNIYNIVHAYNYTPCKLELIRDFGIEAGDIVTVNGITTMIMSKSWDSTGVRMESTGNSTREINDSKNSEILALIGKTNVLTRTLDETNSKITSIESDMGTVKTDVSEVKQTASSLSSTVSSVKQDMVDYKSGVDSQLQQMSTNITQTSESITSTVNGLQGEVNTVKQSLNGVVYESSLADGTTTINGGCITTGTIDADRINMTGSITWSDLSTSVKNTINNAGGLDESEVTTLITSQLVSSPNIQGADYWSEDKNTHMDLLDATSVSSGIGGGIEVTGGSTQIFKAWRSATLNVTLSSYGTNFLQITSTGDARPLGNWDFSSATVTGLDGLGGEVTVKAVWGS